MDMVRSHGIYCWWNTYIILTKGPRVLTCLSSVDLFDLILDLQYLISRPYRAYSQPNQQSVWNLSLIDRFHHIQLPTSHSSTSTLHLQNRSTASWHAFWCISNSGQFPLWWGHSLGMWRYSQWCQGLVVPFALSHRPALQSKLRLIKQEAITITDPHNNPNNINCMQQTTKNLAMQKYQDIHVTWF